MSRVKTIKTILRLARKQPKHATIRETELQKIVEDKYDISFDTATEDQLELVIDKLTGTKDKPKPKKEAAALTNFKAGDKIAHLKRPAWGDGHIVGVTTYPIGDELLQKLDIIFSDAGRKTLIVRPGMLQKI